MALGGIKVINKKGLTVGKDLLVAGFYNTSAIRQHFLPISSIGYNVQAILEKLLEHAFDDNPCDEEISTIEYIRE
jgi:DNA-binding LacI/PurR family transcriptional regulator